MEHVISTTSLVFPTTCRNYYDPYQQKSMAPSFKTYTIRNESARKPKKIDSLAIIRNNPPEFHNNTCVPIPTHPAQKSIYSSAPDLETVPEQRSAPVPASGITDKEDVKPVFKIATDKPTAKPLKPILKPAPAILTDSQRSHMEFNHRREAQHPQGKNRSPGYTPHNSTSPNISPSSSKSYRSTDHIIHPRNVDKSYDEKSGMPSTDTKNKSFFSFSCLRPRKKSIEKPAPSFRVLNSRLSEYEVPNVNPLPVPPKPRQHDIRSEDIPIPRYKFLYPRVPENIPGTAGINSFSPVSTRTPTPAPKSKRPKQPKQSNSEAALPPRRVVKRLSSHLSRHPAVRGLMSQYPTVEMYEKRTGFDTYFDSPFVEYSHSYWTSLHRPPSPFKRTKPLKVKFQSPVTTSKRATTKIPAPAYLETYGPKRDLGHDVDLIDEYSYPYSPDEYEKKKFQFGFARDSIEEVALLGGRRFSAQRQRSPVPEMKIKPRSKTHSNVKADERPRVRFLSPTGVK